MNASKIKLRKIKNTKIYPLLFVFSLAAGIYFTIINGSEVQSYLTTLATSDATSIYSSSYQDGFVKFPSLKDWVFQGLFWPYIFVSLCVALVALRKNRAKEIFSWCVISLAGTLTLVDVTSSLIYSKLSAVDTVVNLGSNVAGAFVVAALVLLCIKLVHVIISIEFLPKLLRQFIGLAIPVSGGLLVSIATCLIISMFYKPNPIKIESTLNLPISGYFSPDESKHGINGEYDRNRPFQFFPRQVGNGQISVLDPIHSIHVDWKELKGDPEYSVELSFYESCLFDDNGKPLPLARKKFILNNVKSLKAFFDDGQTKFFTNGNSSFEIVKFEDYGKMKDISPFSIQKEGKAKTLKLTRVIDEAKFSFTAESRPVEFYLGALLVGDKSAGESAILSRTFTLSTDKETFQIKLLPPSNIRANEPVSSCRFSELNQQSNVIAIRTGSLDAGFLIHLIPQSGASLGVKTKLDVDARSGWFILSGVGAQDLSNGTADGWLKTIQDNGRSVLLAGSKRFELGPADSFFMWDGSVFASYTEDGNVTINGNARYLMRNGDRLNRTKWENLDWPWRTVLFTLFSTICTLLTNLFFKVIRKQDFFDELTL